MAGKFWGNGNYMKVGGPDAVYEDGEIWEGMVAVGMADAAYDDDGAAAAYAMLHLF